MRAQPAPALAAWLERPLTHALEPLPPCAVVESSAAALAALMHNGEVAEIVLVDADGRALGLVRAGDLLQTLATDPDLPAPSGAGARSGMIVDAAAKLGPTVFAMRGSGAERAVAVDADGRPVGLLRTEAALASALGPGFAALATNGSEGVRAQAEVARGLRQDGMAASAVQAVLAALNDEAVARTTRACLEVMAEDGWGGPPVPFAVIQMGSGGRRESLLGSDQDNGFVLADYPNAAHGTVDRWFVELAERLTAALDVAGYPLCPGHVMATNPLWRKPLAQWRDQVLRWTLTRSNQAILQTDIFFDFRAVYGRADLAEALRGHVLEVVADSRPFLAQMCWRQKEARPPLGLFGHLDPDGPLDLKLWAALPLTELVRIAALGHGSAATGTRARLDTLAELGFLPADLYDLLADGHAFLAELRLDRQLADLAEGRRLGHVVRPRELGAAANRRLEELFKDVERLRRKVLGAYLGAIT